MRLITALAAFLVLGACATRPEMALVTQCQAARPQVCTMEYDPVCARLIAGGRKTYASPCNACADDAVGEFLRGACPE